MLATGARPRRLTLPGAELDGVCELRTLADGDALRERLNGGRRVAIVGAGWIGCEVAASARSMGLEVTLIEPVSLPLQRALGPRLGEFYRDLHAEHGVRMLLGHGVARFEGKRGGAIHAVCLDDGTRVACDFAVVGVGVTPRDELAERSGIETADGILVDEYLETSSANVFAAGDVARAYHPLLQRSVRVEHWANALHQGLAAARNMLGAHEAYERLPYFYSDQYDVAMEYTGHAAEWDDVVIRGDLAAREFIAFWLRDGRVRAAMNVNVWGMTQDIEALIRAGEPVDRRRLADTGRRAGRPPAGGRARVVTARTFHHSRFTADRLRVERVETVSVCVPARDEAPTIARVVAALVALRDAKVIDQVSSSTTTRATGRARSPRRSAPTSCDRRRCCPSSGPSSARVTRCGAP